MTGYSSLCFGLLQGLATAALLVLPMIVVAFGFRLRTRLVDLLYLGSAIAVLALVTTLLFLPFEGAWAAAVPFRAIPVGAMAVLVAMAVTQRKLIARGHPEAMLRLVAGAIIGAIWGAAWTLTGCAMRYVCSVF